MKEMSLDEMIKIAHAGDKRMQEEVVEEIFPENHSGKVNNNEKLYEFALLDWHRAREYYLDNYTRQIKLYKRYYDSEQDTAEKFIQYGKKLFELSQLGWVEAIKPLIDCYLNGWYGHEMDVDKAIALQEKWNGTFDYIVRCITPQDDYMSGADHHQFKPELLTKLALMGCEWAQDRYYHGLAYGEYGIIEDRKKLWNDAKSGNKYAQEMFVHSISDYESKHYYETFRYNPGKLMLVADRNWENAREHLIYALKHGKYGFKQDMEEAEELQKRWGIFF